MADTKRRLGAALLMVSVAALAAACGSADSGAGAAADGTSTVPRFPTTASTAEVPVTAPGTHTLEFRPVLALRPAPPETTCEAVPLAADVSGTLYECKGDAAVAVYEVGPVALDGSAVERADTSTNQGGQALVSPTFTETGIGEFNAAATACHAQGPTCPTGQLAIVLDGLVVSAPVVQQASFARDQIQITGALDAEQAADTAARINSARSS